MIHSTHYITLLFMFNIWFLLKQKNESKNNKSKIIIAIQIDEKKTMRYEWWYYTCNGQIIKMLISKRQLVSVSVSQFVCSTHL